MKRKFWRILSFIICVAMVIGLTSALSFSTIGIDVEYSVTNKGITNVYRELQALPNLGNVMYLAAHPDDENNAFLANLTWGFKVEGSYVVNNWGEGGDNWIGPELYGALGVVRSQELLSARMFDGTKQFYVGAFDFGYTTSLVETMIDNNPVSPTYEQAGKYNWQIYAYNMARLIRLERPDVLVSGHWGYGGHGQHQANGILVQYAYAMAGDPDFEIADYDGNPLPAWQPRKLYASYSATYNRNPDGSTSGAPSDNIEGSAPLVIDNGEYSPLLGMCYAEWGNLGRGMHKCQRVAPSAPIGERLVTWGLKAKADNIALTDATTLFGGIDITYNRIWKEMVSLKNQGLLKGRVSNLINDVNKMINRFNPNNFLAIGSDLTSAMNNVKLLEDLIKGSSFQTEPAVINGVTQNWLDTIKDKLNTIAQMIYGITVEISSNDDELVPGQTATITTTAWVRGQGAYDKVMFPDAAMAGDRPTAITVPEGWAVSGSGPVDLTQGGAVVGKRYTYQVTVPADYKTYTGPFNAPYDEYMPSRNSQYPYGSLDGDPAYWDSLTNRAQTDQINFGLTTVVNDPYSTSPVFASVPFRIAGNDYTCEKVPKIRIVPKISLLVKNDNAMLMLDESDQNNRIEVIVKNNMISSASNVLVTATADGWGTDSKTITSISSQGSEQSVVLNLTVPGGFEGNKQVYVTAQLGSEIFNEGFVVVDYDHINKNNFYKASIQNVNVANFAVADGLRIGYVLSGNDDYVVDFIRLMYKDPTEGVNNVKTLTPASLTSGTELASMYDTIVIGKQAWNSIPDIRLKVDVLVDFANAGGNLVVHYQNARVGNNMPIAPVPFPLGGTNINAEDCPVYIGFGDATAIADHDFYYGVDLELTSINGAYESASYIWDGWIQQRTEWTAGRTSNPLGEIAAVGYDILFYGKDPGDTATGRPAVLYKEMDNGGRYTYSSVVWERQLQELVPGAYILYANLLSLGNR